jgi:CubicO group peptidase (beta-lactamase class C family)
LPQGECILDELRIEGTCDPRFRGVKEAFAENFTHRYEYGASAAVVIDGRAVVDLWAGHADNSRTIPWRHDTLVNLFSTTKGLTAICAHRLVDQGLLDLDVPVAAYWPKFAGAGKDHICVRQLLNHRAGLPALHKPVPEEAIYDWNAMTSALAAEEPWWTPGTRHGYHAITMGFLVGEVIRRITDKSLGCYFRDEIAGPLGLDCHIGLAPEDDTRCGQMIQSPAPPKDQINIFKYAQEHRESVTAKAFFNPPGSMKLGAVNSRTWRGAEIPAANGHGTARALARLYGALAASGAIDGVRVLEPEAIARCHTEESSGRDEVLMMSTRFSTGFMLSQPHDPMGPNARTFGHPGAGGSLGFADPDARIGFGYTMNKMGPYILMDPRPRALVEALYASL